MDKEELKEYVINMGLEEDIESILLREIDATDVINQEFLNRIAAMLDSLANAYEKSADMMEKAEEIYDKFEEELKIIDEEEQADIAEAELASDEEFLVKLETKVKEMELKDAQTASETIPVPPVQSSTTPPVTDVPNTNHPAAAILNRPIMPPGISHQQTGPNISNIPSELPNLNPNPVD